MARDAHLAEMRDFLATKRSAGSIAATDNSTNKPGGGAPPASTAADASSKSWRIGGDAQGEGIMPAVLSPPKPYAELVAAAEAAVATGIVRSAPATAQRRAASGERPSDTVDYLQALLGISPPPESPRRQPPGRQPQQR